MTDFFRISDFHSVANFVNNLENISGSIPVPVSFILTVTSPMPPVSFLSIVTCIVSSSFVNFKALLNKLEMTWDILSLSASMGKRSAFWRSSVMEGNKQDNSILR